MPDPDRPLSEEELLAEIQRLSGTPGLSKPKLRELDEMLVQLEWARCKRDPYYFLTSMVRTKDEHALARGEADPYRPFPRNLRHVEELTRWWERGQARGPERIGVVPKSRQMSVTWVLAALYLWKCMVKPATRVAIQTKKEEDADKVLERIYGVWDRLPLYVQKLHPCRRKYCEVSFGNTDSSIHGLAQGPDQARSLTFTDFMADEMAFQDATEATFTAIQPTLDQWGSFVGVSSAGPGFFAEACQADEEVGTYRVLVPSEAKKKGVVTWQNVKGFSVLQIHYSAHPWRDEEWVERESKRYPGGREGKYWRGEMEIDFGAKQGRLVYESFDRSVHVIEMRKDEVPEEWPLFRVIDPGFRNPCCVLFVCMDGDGTFYVIDEIYESGLKVPEVASRIKALTGRRRAQFTLIGHDAFRETQSAGKNLAAQFADEGIVCNPVDTKIDPGIVAVARTLMTNDLGEPGLKILGERCPKLIWEFENYRYPELSEDEKEKRSEKEKPLPVNDHAMDCLRYVVQGVPADYMRRNMMKDRHRGDRDGWISRRRSARERILGRRAVPADPDEELWDE